MHLLFGCLITAVTLLAVPGCRDKDAGSSPATAAENPAEGNPATADPPVATASLTPPAGSAPLPATKTASEPDSAGVKILSRVAQGTVEEQREAALAAILMAMLEERHVSGVVIDDELSRRGFDKLLKRLDPSKMFLLQSDVDEFSKSRETLDDQLRRGSLQFATEAAERFQTRLAVVDGVIQDVLKAPLNLADDEQLETDTKKRPWAKTEAELRERWRKTLELRVLRRVAGKPDPESKETPKPVAERETAARESLAKRYRSRFARLKQQTHTDAMERLVNALLNGVDPHSAFMPPARRDNFDIRMSGQLEGIGAVLSEDDAYIKVVRIVPGSASWRAGELKAGDLILGVTNPDTEPVDITDMRLREVVQLIRGPKGTVVVLSVKKPDARIVSISITRDVVNLEASWAKGAVLEHPGLGRVGYIDLPSFYGNTRKVKTGKNRSCTLDVRALLEAFDKEGVKRVILDLRGNGGGLLSDARSMAGLFLTDGDIVQLKGGEKAPRVLRDSDGKSAFDGPVVVLVDRFTASASEIVAGALQDHRRAVIVGTAQTHGKGTVQVLHDLDEMVPLELAAAKPLGMLKLTQRQFFRVSGSSTQIKGTAPDILLPDPSGHIESGERYHDYPIPWSKTAPTSFTPLEPTWDLDALKRQSAARLEKGNGFERTKKRSALLDRVREDTIEPLSLDKFIARSEAETAAFKAVEEPENAPALFEARYVAYDDTPGAEVLKATVAQRDEWVKSLVRNPWIMETLFILRDMEK